MPYSRPSRRLCEACLLDLGTHKLLLRPHRLKGEAFQSCDYVLHSSHPLGEDEKEDACAELYADFRIEALRHVNEHYYIPRLIISAVVFLVAYLFFSLVIRDPLPMLDEIIISFALSAASFVLMRRGSRKTALFRLLCEDCLDSLTSLDETVDDSLAQAEGYIRRLGEEWSIPELARLLAEGGLPSYEGDAPAWLRRLLVDYAHREEKIYGAFLRQLAKGPDPGLEYRLRERAAQDNLDLRLLSFMYILDR